MLRQLNGAKYFLRQFFGEDKEVLVKNIKNTSGNEIDGHDDTIIDSIAEGMDVRSSNKQGLFGEV